MRILVVGAGVIGSVYAGKLLAAGHEVVMLARGHRLSDLRTQGLILEDAQSEQRSVVPVTAVGALPAGDRYDLVLVAVRSEQLAGTLPLLTGMGDGSDVLFFGNTGGQQSRLVDALGGRALFGFPAAGGVRNGAVIRYVLIDQQQTMFGEPTGVGTTRLQRLATVLRDAGFVVTVSSDVDGWLVAHAAFVVPIAFALDRVGVDAARLAADRAGLRLMVRATRQAFRALLADGNAEIPRNLRLLYLRLPEEFAVRYWRHVLAGPRGELWFAAHTRAAPEEMRALADDLRAAVIRTGHEAPDLTRLLRRRGQVAESPA
jgi:2-dehydropantoate 2-reductase